MRRVSEEKEGEKRKDGEEREGEVEGRWGRMAVEGRCEESGQGEGGGEWESW